MSARRVETARLLLTALADTDLDDLHAILSDARTWEHAPHGRHADVAQTEHWLDGVAQLWQRDGLCYWFARRRADGAPVGVGGVRWREQAGFWNLYYRLAPAMWGHGYAGELCRAALDAARTADLRGPVRAWVLPHNTASIRVVERLGFTSLGPAEDPSDGVTRLVFG